MEKQALLTPDFLLQSQRERRNPCIHPLSSLVSTMRQWLYPHTDQSGGPAPSKVRGPKKGIKMVVVCTFKWERAGGMLPKPFTMPSSRMPVCMCQTKLWETDSMKAKYPLVWPVHTWAALKLNWLCKRAKLVDLPLAFHRLSKRNEVPIENEIICEWVWWLSTAIDKRNV